MTSFAVPDSTHHRATLADWMELSAVASIDGRVPFKILSSAVQDELDEQVENIAFEDADLEQHILDVQSELQARARIVGEGYPFKIDAAGNVLLYNANLTNKGCVYLFCLFLSHCNDRTIISKQLAPRIDNRIRDLFQACATWAAAGYVQGSAISFGWPRPDKSDFLRALKKVYKLFGDGTPHNRPRPAASAKTKDNGVDIIAWRISTDGLPGTHYLLGQVASGNNWSMKSILSDSKHFHDYWFKHRPASPPQDAMFMPFCLKPEASEPGIPYETLEADYLQSLVYRYGVVFYRHRIARHAAEGLSLHDSGVPNIERTESVQPICKWVTRYSARLRAA